MRLKRYKFSQKRIAVQKTERVVGPHNIECTTSR
jgi:hypothetical protein